MGGPIVRTGTTPAFWQNWEKAFGKSSAASRKTKSKKPTAKKPVKNTKAKPAGKAKKKKK